MVLDTETLNDVVKFQVEQEDGRRVKNKPLIENLQVKKKKLIDALCKVSYDDFLSFDKIVSIICNLLYLYSCCKHENSPSICAKTNISKVNQSFYFHA